MVADLGQDRLSAPQARAGRALLGWSPSKVAETAGLPVQTVERFEAEGFAGAQPDAIAKIRRALEEAGVSFIFENGGGVGARLREGPKPELIDVQDLNASNDE